ncbi:MAG: hypothetical protein ACRC4W_00705 [Treponemataceae bacterium]
MKRIAILLASVLLLACMSVSCENLANLMDEKIYVNESHGLITLDPDWQKGFFVFENKKTFVPTIGKYEDNNGTVTFFIYEKNLEVDDNEDFDFDDDREPILVATGTGTLTSENITIADDIKRTDGDKEILIPAGIYTKLSNKTEIDFN